jgi:hypothetical protein
MTRNERLNEFLDQALRRWGTPSREDLEAARVRIRQSVRSTNPSDMTALPLLDTKPVSLWGLRQPFLISGGALIAFAALTATTVWIFSGSNPAGSVSEVAVERARSGSEPPVNQADTGEGLRPAQSNETTVTPAPGIGTQSPRAKAVKTPEPKRLEEAKSPEPAVTGVGPTAPEAVPLPEPVRVQLEPDSGRAVLDRVCTVCHSLRGIEKHSYTSPDVYKELVSDMISRGAVVSEEEMATIVEYLYRTYGQR